jgi:hypothetical protein
MLDKVLKRSDAVDKESLCILAGQRVRSAFKLEGMIFIICLTGLAHPLNVTFSGGRRKHA